MIRACVPAMATAENPPQWAAVCFRRYESLPHGGTKAPALLPEPPVPGRWTPFRVDYNYMVHGPIV
jgi:hypothetical protein